MNRFQNILNESLNDLLKHEEAMAWRSILSWVNSIPNINIVVSEGEAGLETDYLLITKKESGIEWDPQSDQLLDSGDVWEDDDEDQIYIQMDSTKWHVNPAGGQRVRCEIGVGNTASDWHDPDQGDLLFDFRDFDKIKAEVLQRIEAL